MCGKGLAFTTNFKKIFSPAYIAPEVVKREKHSTKSDIWSLKIDEENTNSFCSPNQFFDFTG